MTDGIGEEGVGRDEAAGPVAVGPGTAAPEAAPGTPAPTDGGAMADASPADPAAEARVVEPGGPDASLLALVDRLAAMLEKSDLGELEVGAGGTTIVLRAPSAIERPVAIAPPELAAATGAGMPEATPGAGVPAAATASAARPAVRAPLTGIYYSAPSPGATPYVQEGDQVAVGQLIGLIEAMKLFNEIKSDLAGRVVKVCVDNGALVKAKQPLIEVEPL